MLTDQGYLGDYPYPVWYNPKGVTNILSLNNVAKHYRVTMDTACNKSMIVHLGGNSKIVFALAAHGLWVHKLNDQQSINTMWTMISTVAEKASLYSKRAHKRALMARKLQTIIMRPSTRKYYDVDIEYMADCPVTKADIITVENKFGPNIGSLKGKTVRRPNEHIALGIDPVPQEVLEIYREITLSIDIMFVNKIPFFVRGKIWNN
jgi:hypothetical protein